MKLQNIEQHYLITKNNNLINAKYSLTTLEQKFILAIISLIEPMDNDTNIFSVEVSNMCNILGLESTSKYTDMKNAIKNLDLKDIYIETILPNNKKRVTKASWVSAITYTEGESIVQIEIPNSLKPYLVQLKEKFTSYSLDNILKMDKKYSIRLYEIFKSKLHRGNSIFAFSLGIEQLKDTLMCNKYSNFDFKRTVLNPSLEEINKKTDIYIYYDEVKKGRTIISFNFSVYDKAQMENNLYGDN